MVALAKSTTFVLSYSQGEFSRDVWALSKVGPIATSKVVGVANSDIMLALHDLQHVTLRLA